MDSEAAAEGIRLRKFAEYKAEADGISLKMGATAEGIQKQVESLSGADQQYLILKLLEGMPEVFANVKPEKMLVVGDNPFGSLAKTVVPFLEILPNFSEFAKKLMNKATGTKNADEDET